MTEKDMPDDGFVVFQNILKCVRLDDPDLVCVGDVDGHRVVVQEDIGA